ncbi:8987_t:CDS:2 [Gigaspora margarita]|uniref:8987_t:CDS:1 n=1 Tax=Gigaspora margarita TaxID=4874 RepID=A0ABN7UFE3_GIGMA|nr:8987_t:CDS:2 [Gigaspora margarita]
MYYRNAHLAIVVYDIMKASMLDEAKSWVKELQRQANPNIIIALVGNKIDLVQDFEDYEETSAKERVGVQDVFVEMVKRCVDEIKQQDAIKQQTAIKQQDAIK